MLCQLSYSPSKRTPSTGGAQRYRAEPRFPYGLRKPLGRRQHGACPLGPDIPCARASVRCPGRTRCEHVRPGQHACAAGWRPPLNDAHAMVLSICKRVHPRVALCRGGGTRTPGTQFWRLLFLPLNYAPMQLSEWKSRPAGAWSRGRLAMVPFPGLPRSRLAQARVFQRPARHGVLTVGCCWPGAHRRFLLPFRAGWSVSVENRNRPVGIPVPGGGWRCRGAAYRSASGYVNIPSDGSASCLPQRIADWVLTVVLSGVLILMVAVA